MRGGEPKEIRDDLEWIALVGPSDDLEELRGILSRDGARSPRTARGMNPSSSRPLHHSIEPLTPRDIEVLALLADGLSNKTIGSRIGTADRIVKHHVAAICAKLGVEKRTDAATRGSGWKSSHFDARRRLRRPRGGAGEDTRAPKFSQDALLRDDQLHSPVLLTAGGGVVRRHRGRLAQTS